MWRANPRSPDKPSRCARRNGVDTACGASISVARRLAAAATCGMTLRSAEWDRWRCICPQEKMIGATNTGPRLVVASRSRFAKRVGGASRPARACSFARPVLVYADRGNEPRNSSGLTHRDAWPLFHRVNRLCSARSTESGSTTPFLTRPTNEMRGRRPWHRSLCPSAHSGGSLS
jgi:hypothetical protein